MEKIEYAAVINFCPSNFRWMPTPVLERMVESDTMRIKLHFTSRELPTITCDTLEEAKNLVREFAKKELDARKPTTTQELAWKGATHEPTQ